MELEEVVLLVELLLHKWMIQMSRQMQCLVAFQSARQLDSDGDSESFRDENDPAVPIEIDC